MFDTLHQRWHQFAAVPPGQRFQAHFARQQQIRPRGLHQKILAGGGGVLVMGAGLFFLRAPGPGLLIFLIGALRVAEESRTVARRLDGADLRLRRLAAWATALSGANANFLWPSLEQAGYRREELVQNADKGQLKPLAEEARAWRELWSAGHGVATIHDVPTARALCDRLAAEYRAACAAPASPALG